MRCKAILTKPRFASHLKVCPFLSPGDASFPGKSVSSCAGAASDDMFWGLPPPGGPPEMKYDAIIIGSGQAGNPLAYRLADPGWSVALIERKNLGGTCVSVDLAKIVAQKDEVVLSFRSNQQKQVDKRATLRLHRGHARFVGQHQLKVGAYRLES